MPTPATLVLPTCCGMEFLLQQSNRFVSLPNSIFCVDRTANNTIVPLELYRGVPIICPCVARAIQARNATITNGALTVPPDVCANLSSYRLIDGVCASAPACPAGQRALLQLGQSLASPAAVCNSGGQMISIVETQCERTYRPAFPRRSPAACADRKSVV